jgi:hypothetical protein
MKPFPEIATTKSIYFHPDFNGWDELIRFSGGVLLQIAKDTALSFGFD